MATEAGGPAMANEAAAARAAPAAGGGAPAKPSAVEKFARDAAAACHTLLNRAVTGVDHPGGDRYSVRVRCGDESVIVTRRSSVRRARLEVSALYALGSRGGHVPKVLAFDGIWLIQEDLGGRRLSQALAGADTAKGRVWLEAAVASLAANHRAAKAAALENSIVTICTDPAWFKALTTMPARLGRLLGHEAPPVPAKEIADMLRVRQPCFIKWDARSGNAIAREDGTVAWFDWEHSGCRNRIDDLVWLLADEFTPDWPDAEAALLARVLPEFADDWDDKGEAAVYFATFATLHSCARLSLILTSKKDGPWWNADRVLGRDQVGVTRRGALTCLARAARWARKSPLTQALAPWLERLPGRLPPDNGAE